MEKSLFIQYVDKYFRPLVTKVTQTINGKKQEEQLLHKTMLTEEYSADLSWASAEVQQSIVAADVVSMDSSLPLKRRDTLSKASGALPKIGIKFRKGERDITRLNVAIAQKRGEEQIARILLDDVPKTIKGVDTRKEIMFQEALSQGYTLVPMEGENPQTGIRVDFGYKAENTFHALKAAWGQSTATPQDDVQQLFDKAASDGNSIGLVMMSKKYFDLFRKSEQGKLLAANSAGQVIVDKTLLPIPTRARFLEVLESEYGVPFRTVDSTFRVEMANGQWKNVRPWAEANIVALPSENVGRLVYGTLAEETNPVANVTYQKSGTHILVAKYSKTDPLEEFTTGQALCLPVIDGVSGIYVLHADSVSGLTIDPATLNFTKDADQTGKVITVGHADGKVGAKSDQTWATVSVKSNQVTVKVEANSAAQRTANVTVSDSKGNSATCTVTQATGA